MSAATWQVRFGGDVRIGAEGEAHPAAAGGYCRGAEEFVFVLAEFIQVETVRGGDLHIGDEQALLVELPLV